MNLALICSILAQISIVRTVPLFRAEKQGVSSETEAIDYLAKYGYFSNLPTGRSPGGADAQIHTIVERKAMLAYGLKQFQLHAHLPVSGRLDAATKAKMGRRRCGMPDRIQRNSFGENLWTAPTLYWAVVGSGRNVNESITKRVMTDAIAAWSAHIPVDFVHVSPADPRRNIAIDFGRLAHGDAFSFDGRGHVLAHAFYPPNGRLHFDDDEQWAFRDSAQLAESYTDISSVALHEMGHILGLRHSSNQETIMASYYREKRYAPNDVYEMPKLHKEDIERIEKLYGKAKFKPRPEMAAATHSPRRTTRPSTTAATTTTPTTTTATTTRPSTITRLTTRRPLLSLPSLLPSDDPHRCPSSFDAATLAVNGHRLVFVDNYVYRWDAEQHISQRALITDIFPAGPQRVTAAVSNGWSKLTLLFSGRTVYAYEIAQLTGEWALESGFPKQLPKLVTITPQYAFTWRDGNQVLVQDGTFITYDENWNVATLTASVPDYFPNLPTNVASIVNGDVTGNDRRELIVITQDDMYYRYDTESKSILPGFPQPTRSLFRCL